MKAAYLDILRHSAIYGIGQALLRAASILLLPIYTRYLRPDEYGVLAILDLGVGVLGILIGAGMSAAVSRIHFETKDPEDRGPVWWTGLGIILLTASTIILPPLLGREQLATALLGDAYPDGGAFVAMALATLWFRSVVRIADTRLRVQKRSTILVVLSVTELLVNIALNLTFLIHFKWGVKAMLAGNLLTSMVSCTAYWALVYRSLGPVRISSSRAGELLRFGMPLIGTSLLSLLMHQADRYFLRVLIDIETLGIYSVGYTIGQGVNTMLLIPFASIWNVAIYEIAAESNAPQSYARVFRHYFEVIMFVMLTVSLLARPVLSLVVAEEFRPAALYVPTICLAYVLWGLHEHFKVPAMLAKRTMKLLPAYAVAAAANVGLNVFLIPALGAMGAAFASVLTFGLFSFTGLAMYRRISYIPYDFKRFAVVLVACIATYLLFSRFADWGAEPIGAAVLAALMLLLAGAIVLGPLVRMMWSHGGF